MAGGQVIALCPSRGVYCVVSIAQCLHRGLRGVARCLSIARYLSIARCLSIAQEVVSIAQYLSRRIYLYLHLYLRLRLDLRLDLLIAQGSCLISVLFKLGRYQEVAKEYKQVSMYILPQENLASRPYTYVRPNVRMYMKLIIVPYLQFRVLDKICEYLCNPLIYIIGIYPRSINCPSECQRMFPLYIRALSSIFQNTQETFFQLAIYNSITFCLYSILHCRLFSKYIVLESYRSFQNTNCSLFDQL